jgi:hypothetical protein
MATARIQPHNKGVINGSIILKHQPNNRIRAIKRITVSIKCFELIVDFVVGVSMQ